MKNKLKKTAAFVLALTLTAGAVPAAIGGAAIVAKADNAPVSDYTLTIPASFDIKNEGWNEIGDISVTGQLADGGKLMVNATSDGEFALVNQSDDTQKIGYTLKNSAEGEITTSWEFTSLSETPATQTIGVDVEPFKDKPAGKYTDVVTFTASVEKTTKTLTLTGQYVNYYSDEFDDGECSFEIEYTDNDTWNDIVERYGEVSFRNSDLGPDGKIIMLKLETEKGSFSFELKSEKSNYKYKLVSINDKVSAYDSYYLQQW